MMFRIHEWANTETGEPAFGVQSKQFLYARYRHSFASVGGKNRALIYGTRERAEAVIRALEAGNAPDFETGLVALKNCDKP
jgi:hypothetical protein